MVQEFPIQDWSHPSFCASAESSKSQQEHMAQEHMAE
jgi:hypothetical protein